MECAVSWRTGALLLRLVLVALALAAILQLRCKVGDEPTCRLLGVLQGSVRLPLPPPSNQQPANASIAALPLVLYTEEGTYFGGPWPLSNGRGAAQFVCQHHGAEVLAVRKNPPVAEALLAMRSGTAAAHVRVVHSPDSQCIAQVRALRTSARDWLVHYTMESPLMWPADLDAEYMGLFNGRWSYHRQGSLLPSAYFARAPVIRQRKPIYRVPWARKLRARLLVTGVSNCADYNGRAAYLKALARVPALQGRYINYGRCHPAGDAKLPPGKDYWSKVTITLTARAHRPPPTARRPPPAAFDAPTHHQPASHPPARQPTLLHLQGVDGRQVCVEGLLLPRP